jgi:hypothetical protein
MKPIPDGFVLLAKYDERVGIEHKSGPRGDYAKLLRELAKGSPAIAAYKDGGQWVAREADIKEFLARSSECCDRPRRKRSAVEVPDRVVSLLERIAEALETIATNPRNDDHTPFGSLLHASTNGDE